jgi:predicted  nucleic acid-binding Zn-ribbon protein
LNRIDNLKDNLNSVHHHLYDETYCSGSLRHELDELNKKYTNLLGEHEMTLCKLKDLEDNIKDEEEGLVRPWSRRII